ncbi:MAG: alanine--tRNA ligase-related protein, partial [Armatimonadota bacterium]|nr:alanine--tRNA ligase-related protein [Armatimonadota bacterium]
MTGNELRDAFLRFFEEKGHKVLPSYPLVLPEDPSTLFTVAGMQPFSPVFRGEVPPPAPRVATSQKVFREGDLDAVGVIGRYHTFYEMLGNFSFGDYFKREAVEFGWEFVTQVMKLPPEKLWVTIYEEDEETAGYWREAANLPPERIVRLGKKDNWWPQVAWDGPCGPCSEIYLDRGPAWGCGEPDCKPGCNCDRFLEFWNLVFQMYIQDASGTIRGNLPHPGIDTGMGLERAACLVMDVPSNYETDLVVPVIQQLVKVLQEDEGLDIHYTPFRAPDGARDARFSDADEGQSARLRSISDHVRAASFLIADNVRPGPDGRGSVLRRLIRRSFGHGWRLGVRDPFLYRCVSGVVRALGAAYPEIVERQEYIETTIRGEEELFRTTVEAGMQLLGRELETRRKAGVDTLIHKGANEPVFIAGPQPPILGAMNTGSYLADMRPPVLDGNMAFRLATTHGFPLELTRDVAAQYGFTIEQESYDRLMEEFRRQSKDPDKDARGLFTDGLSQVRRERGATIFNGYTELTGTAVVLALLSGREDRDRLQTGEDGVLIMDCTPFYAESGGQVGDVGTVLWPGGRAAVRNTTKLNDLWLHHILVEEGELRTGASVALEVDATRRSLT